MEHIRSIVILYYNVYIKNKSNNFTCNLTVLSHVNILVLVLQVFCNCLCNEGLVAMVITHFW